MHEAAGSCGSSAPVPLVGAAVIFALIATWNEYIVALTLMPDPTGSR